MKISGTVMVISLLSLIVSCESKTSGQNESADPELANISTEILNAIKKDSLESAYGYFGALLKDEMDLDAFKLNIKTLKRQVGQLVESQEYKYLYVNDFECVFIRCRFEQMDLYLKLAFNDSNEVVGIFFVPEIM